MRIYLDTNVVISAMLFPKGKAALVFEHVIKKHTAIISDYTISECKEVFEKKFPDKMEILNSFFYNLEYENFKTPDKINERKYPKIRDIKDLPVLVSAILSDADVLITGDKDFDDVKIKKPLIFKPAQYAELIQN